MSDTVRIALFGHPVGHSRSAEIFTAWSRCAGPAVSYEAVDVEPSRLPAALDELRRGRWDAANVTVPHKGAVIPALDELGDAAGAARAVNVIRRLGEGRLRGENTDGAGFLAGCRARLGADLPPGRVMLLGSGGAARGVAASLVQAGHLLTVVSRDPAAARNSPIGALAAEIVGWSDARQPAKVAAAALVIQATPLGMVPAVEAAPPLDPTLLRPGQRVVDLIYNPWETAFLRASRARGVWALNGWPMLVHQAAAAAELWFGAGSGAGVIEAAAGVEPRDPLCDG